MIQQRMETRHGFEDREKKFIIIGHISMMLQLKLGLLFY